MYGTDEAINKRFSIAGKKSAESRTTSTKIVSSKKLSSRGSRAVSVLSHRTFTPSAGRGAMIQQLLQPTKGKEEQKKSASSPQKSSKPSAASGGNNR
ncbi:hypothetical protein CAC42_6817 [Sphaceloma murrayae]|uniref:Uncharacterized protein n=1 Tax=Sphaceloma murrayae TaxID=2082308 RepID=A0A2K1QGM3_9PEZI|nr:hypothetical protein CAC42_6817 [Sphaceloma murrayae]